MHRRVWCETLPYEDLVAPAVLAPLRAHAITVLVAVRPWQLDELPPVVARLQGEGLPVGVWPMLDDADGRWLSVESASRWVELASEVIARAPRCDEVVLDLEPPLASVLGWMRGRPTLPRWTGGAAFRTARAQLTAAIDAFRPRRVTTALIPLLALEGAGQWMQFLLGTPASRLPVDRHSLMAYTSLYEGWSYGVVGRRNAERLLTTTARLARARFGGRAALSLGCVGAGAFGDEPAYRDPSELARDVALARAAGIDELSVFDLGGMVRRGPIEQWLDAMV